MANKKTATNTTARSKGKWQGMNWITQKKRLAIYLRDGMACAYCAAGVEEGVKLSLDHIKPHSKGGSNHATNLVTCCTKCNSSRGDRPMRTFARGVAEYIDHGATEQQIVAHVTNCSKRVLPLAEAAELIERRGSVAEVLKAV